MCVCFFKFFLRPDLSECIKNNNPPSPKKKASSICQTVQKLVPFFFFQSVQREPDIPVSYSPVRISLTQCHYVWHTGSYRSVLCRQEAHRGPLPQAAERAVSVKRYYCHSESEPWAAC